jgi:peptidoglycan/xylan/chitin deacetylase (PgdA/CDA1 family)
MKLALKVDVATLRGLRLGVPRLIEMFERHAAGATFFFCVGPDHSGRALGRDPPPGHVDGVPAGGFVAHYGVRPLVYGTLWPGPQLARRGAAIMRSVRDSGFECGVQAYDAVRWQHKALHASVAWTEAEMQRAIDRYADVFGEPPHAHAAAGWQTNAHALRMTQRLGFDYCSDGRGVGPYLPVRDAELVRCPQFPTTLPTLDELMAAPNVTPDNAAAYLLEQTLEALPSGHVFALRAEIEGIAIAPIVDQLLTGWRAQGYALVALRDLFESVEPLSLPRCEVEMARIAGRHGPVLIQGPEFLGAIDAA